MGAERRITSSESELPVFSPILTRHVLQNSAQHTGGAEVGASINFLGVSSCQWATSLAPTKCLTFSPMKFNLDMLRATTASTSHDFSVSSR